MENSVALKRIDNYNPAAIQKALEELFALTDAQSRIKGHKKVLIKVCAGRDDNPDLATTTHPAVVQGIVNILSDMGCKCIVADSPTKAYTLNNLDKIYFETGLLEVANSTKCELNHDLSTCRVSIPSGVKMKSATLLHVIKDVDAIVNVGKVRVDENLGLMGVASNLFGLVPGEMQNLVLNRLTTVEDFNNYVIDLEEYFKNKTVLNVLDGVVALENNASQRMLSCLAVGANMFSLDALICKLIGKDVTESIVKTAADRGKIDLEKPYALLGEADLNKLVLEDFDFGELNNYSNIHKNKAAQKRYFNHNQQRVVIKQSQCKGCSRCAKVCPTGAICMKFDKAGELYAEIDYAKCIFCNKCFTACPYSVVKQKTPVGYKIINFSITKFND